MTSKRSSFWLRLPRRCSLRTLILLVLVAGLLLGRVVDRIRTQRDAVRIIEHAGWGVLYDWQFIGGVPDYDGQPSAPRWLVDALGPDALGSVACVLADEIPMGSPILPAIGRLVDLRRLEIEGPGVSDEALAHIAGLRHLQLLSLGGNDVGDSGLAHLEGMTDLEELNLNATKVGDAGLMHLRRMSELKILYLGRTRVTDAGLAHLEDFEKLIALNLTETRVTDAGLRRLTGIRSLREVYLSRVVDEGGAPLITEAGLDALRRARPDLKVEYWTSL
jgi:hypothetical protein